MAKILQLQLQHQSFQCIFRIDPLGLTGLISLQSKGLSWVFSNAVVQKHQSFGTQPFLWSSSHLLAILEFLCLYDIPLLSSFLLHRFWCHVHLETVLGLSLLAYSWHSQRYCDICFYDTHCIWTFGSYWFVNFKVLYVFLWRNFGRSKNYTITTARDPVFSCCCSVAKSCPTFCTPWTAACRASLYFTVSLSLLKLMSIESVMPSNHSSSVSLFSFPQSFPASGSFPMNQLFTLGGQNIGASASAPVIPMNIKGWFPLELTGLISLLSKGFSRVFFSTTVWKHQFFCTQLSCFFSAFLFLPFFMVQISHPCSHC